MSTPVIDSNNGDHLRLDCENHAVVTGADSIGAFQFVPQRFDATYVGPLLQSCNHVPYSGFDLGRQLLEVINGFAREPQFGHARNLRELSHKGKALSHEFLGLGATSERRFPALEGRDQTPLARNPPSTTIVSPVVKLAAGEMR